MLLLPFKRFTLLSRLNSTEVNKRLDANIDTSFPKFSLVPKVPTKPYRGKFDENGFRIERIILYRNSFLPVIKGKITSNFVEQEIRITMRPSIFVLIFMMVWLGITGSIGFFLSAVMFKEESFSGMSVIPIAMFFFGYAILILSFHFEAVKSKKFLIELFKADIK